MSENLKQVKRYHNDSFLGVLINIRYMNSCLSIRGLDG